MNLNDKSSDRYYCDLVLSSDWLSQKAQSKGYFFCLNMSGFIIGAKSTQKQMFAENGQRVPVTTITTNPCFLIDFRTPERDGYSAVILGFGKTRKISKPNQGKLKKAGIDSPLRSFREIRIEKAEFIENEAKKGIKINESEFYIGDQMNP
ncbi:MAG TPA: hypothetical protein VK338_05335, partial [Candidatus Nitrosocosmicus sp.]|nr:hypothetical protein [Candidatus Nitrosocosmicus sp.]